MSVPAEAVKYPDYPFAPAGWSPDAARRIANLDGVTPSHDHWHAVRALQEYFARHADDPHINTRDLRDALDECFHVQGGMKYLYQLFPGGPIAQGCRLAGLAPPAGSSDRGFGSVQ